MFTGTYPLSVDDKGRVAIPSRFRQLLVEKYGSQVYLTRTYLPCVEIYPVAVFHPVAVFRAVVEQLEAMPDRRKADLAMRAFLGSAMETEIDKQGRVLLPSLLRKMSRLETAAAAVGQNKRIEIWAEDAWTAAISGTSESEALADAFSGVNR
jgi:MraZ protein